MQEKGGCKIMGCVLWRCDRATECPNEFICDDILCSRFLRHDCDMCANRDTCVSRLRLKGKENEKEVTE